MADRPGRNQTTIAELFLNHSIFHCWCEDDFRMDRHGVESPCISIRLESSRIQRDLWWVPPYGRSDWNESSFCREQNNCWYRCTWDGWWSARWGGYSAARIEDGRSEGLDHSLRRWSSKDESTPYRSRLSRPSYSPDRNSSLCIRRLGKT